MWNPEKTASAGKYTFSSVKDHPKANSNGYVYEHRIVMENHIGRLLTENEIVHHIDGNGKNNSIENLQLLTQQEHTALHNLKKGKTLVKLKCPECKTIFIRRKGQTFLVKNAHKYTCCSRHCRACFSRRIQLFGETEESKKAIAENLIEEFINF